MYSDISIRTMCFSSLNSSSASFFASSVLPTPVGPRKRKQPVGFPSRESPSRERRMALLTASMAADCPTTFSLSRCGSWIKRSRSEVLRRSIGMPVQLLTTWQMSFAVTSSLSIRESFCFSISSSWRLIASSKSGST